MESNRGYVRRQGLASFPGRFLGRRGKTAGARARASQGPSEGRFEGLYGGGGCHAKSVDREKSGPVSPVFATKTGPGGSTFGYQKWTPRSSFSREKWTYAAKSGPGEILAHYTVLG